MVLSLRLHHCQGGQPPFNLSSRANPEGPYRLVATTALHAIFFTENRTRCSDSKLRMGLPEEAEGPAVPSPAKQLRRVKALKAAELLDGEAHRRSLGFPGFPVDLVGVDRLHAVFSYGKPHTRLCPVQRGRKSGFARDDKLKGGGPPWQWWRLRDRTRTTATNSVSVCPRSSSTHSASCVVQKAIRTLIWTALIFSRPCGTQFESWVLTQTPKAVHTQRRLFPQPV